MSLPGVVLFPFDMTCASLSSLTYVDCWYCYCHSFSTSAQIGLLEQANIFFFLLSLFFNCLFFPGWLHCTRTVRCQRPSTPTSRREGSKSQEFKHFFLSFFFKCLFKLLNVFHVYMRKTAGRRLHPEGIRKNLPILNIDQTSPRKRERRERYGLVLVRTFIHSS